MPDNLNQLLAMIGIQSRDMQINYRTQLTLHMATISLLIDADLETAEQVAQRIEKVHQTMSGHPYASDVGDRLRPILAGLRSLRDGDPSQWKFEVIQGGKDSPSPTETNDS